MLRHQPSGSNLSTSNYNHQYPYQYNNTNLALPYYTPQFMGHINNHTPNYHRLGQYHSPHPYTHLPTNQHNYNLHYNSNVSGNPHVPSYPHPYCNTGRQYHMPYYQNSFLHRSPDVIDNKVHWYPYNNSFQHQIAKDPRQFQNNTANIGHSFQTSLDRRNSQYVQTENSSNDKRKTNNQLDREMWSCKTKTSNDGLQIQPKTTYVTKQSQQPHDSEVIVPNIMNGKFQILHKAFLPESKIGISISSDENKVIRDWENQYTIRCASRAHNYGEYKQQSRKINTKYQRLGYYYCGGKKGSHN